MGNTPRVDKNLFRDDHYLGKPADDEDRIIGRRIEILEKYPEFFNRRMSCIEVGCGSGSTITRVASRFQRCLGIDIFDYSAAFESKKLQHSVANAEFRQLDLEKDSPGETFDRLISFEVIEHLKSEDSVAAYFDVLKEDGMAAITVPNKWWIFETHGAKLPLLPWNRVPFFSWLPTKIHERYANARIYTAGRIMRLLEKHGFTIIDHSYVTAPMDVLKQGWLKKTLLKYVFRNDTTKAPMLSTSVFVIAQKEGQVMKSTLRILSLIPYKIFPAKLGGEKGIAVFNEYLARQAHLTGITTKNNDPVYAKGYILYNTISNSKLRYGNIFLYFSIRKLLKKERATHFLIEHPYFGWLAWLIKKTINVKWVVHSHNIEYMRSMSIGRWWWKALKWYEGWVYRNADRVFFISEDDMDHAIRHLKADPARSQPVTYGIEQSGLPGDMEASRKKITALHSIAENETILLFNGALYHSTNYDALRIILDQINPVLLAQEQFRYKILVCGKGLPDFFNSLREYAGKNIIYAGFVEDISVYFKAADIFLNPILSGGGVKTKAIEALAMDCTVISTPLGAMGLQKKACGNKLIVVDDGDWKKFGDIIISASAEDIHTPQSFFDHYYWENIIHRVVDKL